MGRDPSKGVHEVLDGEEVHDILRDTFFASEAAEDERPRRKVARSTKERPAHYKVICISLYNDDLSRLDAAVNELKRRGFTKANRSAVLRAAMEQLDLDLVRKGI